MSADLFDHQEMTERLTRIREWMARDGWGALFVEHPANVRYASGFRGEPRCLWITHDQALLITSFRSERWALEQCQTFDVVSESEPLKRVATCLGKRGLKIGVDWDIQNRRLNELRGAWPEHIIEPTQGIEIIRRIKSEAEISLLRKSQELNQRIFERLLTKIRPGMTERTAQGLILAEMAAEQTVDCPAFSPIVAAGANAWEIHHLPDDSVLKKNDMVIIDVGVKVNGYASDMTRTICLGRATQRMREVHAKVREAQLAGIARLRPDVLAVDVDVAARSVIDAAGFGRGFTHGLGHDIGLETHDTGLSLSPKAGDLHLLAGMALTVEPGIYLENEFGVRTEDMLVIRKEGVENLTSTTHDLIELNH
ncbi:MAG: Xaa-Pro peptidase family protein [Luteolibacter sp.]